MNQDQHAARLRELQDELERRQLEDAREPIDESLDKGREFIARRGNPIAEKVEPLREGERVSGQDEFDAALDKIFVEHLVDRPLTFEEYQAGAKTTAIYNRDARVLYPALGLTGEVGEVIEKVLQMAVHAGMAANQVKKIIRDDDCECDTSRKHAIGKEIAGVLWYCAAVCSDLGLNLGDIAQENLRVLASRQERGTLQGDGDNR